VSSGQTDTRKIEKLKNYKIKKLKREKDKKVKKNKLLMI
jgi:hypothetical protein